MKLAIALISVLSFAQIASAAPISCAEKTNPYHITVSSDHKTAQVTKDGEELMFGDLECRIPHSTTPNSAFLVCQSPHVADAGYIASFYYVHKSLIMYARLGEFWFGGTHDRGTLSCVQAMHGLDHLDVE